MKMTTTTEMTEMKNCDELQKKKKSHHSLHQAHGHVYLSSRCGCAFRANHSCVITVAFDALVMEMKLDLRFLEAVIAQNIVFPMSVFNWHGGGSDDIVVVGSHAGP
jgi:hypothetical protein